MTVIHLGKLNKTVVFFQHLNKMDTLWLMRRPNLKSGYEIESGWMSTSELTGQLLSYSQQGYREFNTQIPYSLLLTLQRRQIEASQFPIFSTAVSEVSRVRH